MCRLLYTSVFLLLCLCNTSIYISQYNVVDIGFHSYVNSLQELPLSFFTIHDLVVRVENLENVITSKQSPKLKIIKQYALLNAATYSDYKAQVKVSWLNVYNSSHQYMKGSWNERLTAPV